MDFDVVAEAQAKECKKVFSAGDEVIVASDNFMVMRGYSNEMIHVGDTGVVLAEHLTPGGFRTTYVKFHSNGVYPWWLPNFCLELTSGGNEEPEVSPEEMRKLLFSV